MKCLVMLPEAVMWVCPRTVSVQRRLFVTCEHMKLVDSFRVIPPGTCGSQADNSMGHGILSSISSCQCTPKFHYCSLRPVVVSSFVWKKKKKKLWSHLDWFVRMLWIQFEFKPKPKVLRCARCVWTFSKFCIDAKFKQHRKMADHAPRLKGCAGRSAAEITHSAAHGLLFWNLDLLKLCSDCPVLIWLIICDLPIVYLLLVDMYVPGTYLKSNI